MHAAPFLAGRDRPCRRPCTSSIFFSRRAPSGDCNPRRRQRSGNCHAGVGQSFSFALRGPRGPGDSGTPTRGFGGRRAGVNNHCGGTERGTRRVRSRFPSRFARFDFSGQGRRNLCSGGTRVDRGSRRVAGPQASRAGELSSKSIAEPLSGGEARTDGRDAAEFRHSESQRR